MSEYRSISIVTDGASRGNPGPASIGFAIYEGDLKKLLEEEAKYIGKATNNEAEYQALIWALERVKKYSFERVIHYSDSQLMVRQLRGEYAVRSKRLRPLFRKVQVLKGSLPHCEHRHVARENRYVARVDESINKALDNEGY